MKIAVDRAHLFTHGKHDELMMALNADEKRYIQFKIRITRCSISTNFGQNDVFLALPILVVCI